MELQCLSFLIKDLQSEIKGKLVFREFHFVLFYERVREVLGLPELLVLSTCNRTEFYFFDESNRIEEVLKIFKSLKGITSKELEDVPTSRFTKTNQSFQHLCSVAIGAKSQVLGDIQVISQLKEAYRKAVDLGGVNRYQFFIEDVPDDFYIIPHAVVKLAE